MKYFSCSLFILTTFLLKVDLVTGQSTELAIEYSRVFYEKNMFGGWPANFGIWSWDNEILVGFAKGFYKDLGPERHNIDREKPEKHILARSIDGGETWKIEDPGSADGGALFMMNKGSYHGIERNDIKHRQIKPARRIDFSDPNLAFTIRMTNVDGGESFYWTSYNRGHNWEGPYRLPLFNSFGTAGRTDYLVENKDTCIAFITSSKSNGKEGRVMCIKTMDGGKIWSFVSWIGPEPDGYAIMPASVRLSEKQILVTIRRNRYISCYRSEDNGLNWKKLNNPVDDTGEGNPPAMVKMNDGRICLVYGDRKKPYRIYAKLSSDSGDS